MDLRSIEYRGLRPLKLGLSLPAGIYQVPETVAAQIVAAAALSVGDVAPAESSSPPPNQALSSLTNKELYALAQEAGIPGRSKMDRDELHAALVAHEGAEG